MTDDEPIESEPGGVLRRLTVPGTDIELHEASGLDEIDRAPLLRDEELGDRDWTIKLLQHQATSPESAEAIERLAEETLLEAAQLYAREFEELEPGADFASFRAAIVAAQRERDEELARIVANMKLPGIDASKLAGIDFDKLIPRFTIPRETLDALQHTRITGEQLSAMLPKVSPDLVKGLTDTSGITKAMQEARGSILDRDVSMPITPLPALEFRDWKHEAQLEAMDRQSELLERQGAQTAILTEQVKGLRDDAAADAKRDRPLLWVAAVGALAGALLTGIGIWVAVNLTQQEPTPTPAPTALPTES